MLIAAGVLPTFLFNMSAEASWKFVATIIILGGIYGLVSAILAIWIAHQKIIPAIILFALCCFRYALIGVGIICFAADLYSFNTTSNKRQKTLFTGYWFLRLLCHYRPDSPVSSYTPPVSSYTGSNPSYTPPQPLRYQDPIHESTAALLQRRDPIESNKGAEGEYNVFYTLGLLLNKYPNIKIRNDLLFHTGAPEDIGASSQIDQLVVSKAGIFVFETKTHDDAMYYIDPENEKWRVVNHNSATQHDSLFRSPLWQNKKHCEFSINLLNYNGITTPTSAFHNIAVFAESASLCVGNILQNDYWYPSITFSPEIIKVSHLFYRMDQILSQDQQILSDDEVEHIDSLIAENDDRNPQNHKIHDKFLSQKYSE